ncbi:hypothetical protein RF11_07857 [Thelohanellus kitauei]|uniref:B30.2/SPRY domain-containing protein n=1 Tax=Thelohanellus kitauei TaxID=669202 RepID=A0A0C2ICW9_THEKT|nr:hypothetical protein RF11_07857 [Thelohanellus kitauei]
MTQIGITTAENEIGTIIGQEKGYAIIVEGHKTPFFINEDRTIHLACATGDTIGLGINFMDHHVFFTKNGVKTEATSLWESKCEEEIKNIENETNILEYIFDYMTVHGHSQTRAEIKNLLEPKTENSDERLKITNGIIYICVCSKYN